MEEYDRVPVDLKLDHLHTVTVGNLALQMPTLLGGLPGIEALATKMMKKDTLTSNKSDGNPSDFFCVLRHPSSGSGNISEELKKRIQSW